MSPDNTHDTEAGFLARYDRRAYEAPLTTVDLAIFTLAEGALQILLVKRGEHPHRGRWALPGGFVDLARDASLEATAHRKLVDKTGVATPYLEQVCTVGGPARDPRGWAITVLYMALIEHAPTLAQLASDGQVRWWPWEEAKRLDLAFDHAHLAALARERLRSKTAYTALPVFVLPQPFTLSALQRAFETLMEAPLEKKSFRRRMEESGLLEVVGEGPPEGGRGRPAVLCRPRPGARDHVFARVVGLAAE